MLEGMGAWQWEIAPCCSTFSDVKIKYATYVSGQAPWSEVIDCYNQYAL
jgi:hypothetical protein